MLSRETEQKLVQIFITISVGEEKINKIKQDILSNFNINPIQFFFKLDTNNSNNLTKNDISTYLNTFSIIYTPTDIDYIFYFYDKDFDGVLNFYEFLDLIISDSNYLFKKSYKKKYKHKKIDPNEINSEIDVEMQKSILQIFIEEIELARQLNDLIIDIKRNNDFVIQDIFYEIKSYSYITNDSLKAFFDRNEVTYNDKFIKNIFNRFDNKEINGRISFNKFKNFFDLPYNKNSNENQQVIINDNNTDNYVPNPTPKIMNQSQVSDINLENSQVSDLNFHENYNNNIITNDNYINEEDIQFECSHLSRSGSVESKKEKEQNCGYVLKNNNNTSYKNYLRNKRSKSLEKSLSRSLSRKNEKLNKIDNNKKEIRNIRVIRDDINNNSGNEGMNLSNSGTSGNEDIAIKLPVRLDKNLVQRPLPKRQNNHKNTMDYNFCYDNHMEDPYYNHINHSHNHTHAHQCMNNCTDYTRENIMQNEYGKENMQCNYNRNNIINSNNLDLKSYKEDRDIMNNGRYEEY